MIAPAPLLALFGEAMLRELLHVVRWYDVPFSPLPAPRMSLTLARAFLQTAHDLGIDLLALELRELAPHPRGG
jgi:hypothetical protein